MSDQPWKSKNWFVSEWNYAPEVRKDFKFAKNIKVHDITLRDGEQSPGVRLNMEQKLEIGHALVDLGVDIIEAGFPISSPGDFEACITLARELRGVQICGLTRARWTETNSPNSDSAQSGGQAVADRSAGDGVYPH